MFLHIINQLEVMIMMVMIMRIFACSDKDTNPQYLYTHCRAASVLFHPKRKTSSRNLSTRISTNLANLLNSACVKDGLGRQKAYDMISLFVNYFFIMQEILVLVA